MFLSLRNSLLVAGLAMLVGWGVPSPDALAQVDGRPPASATYENTVISAEQSDPADTRLIVGEGHDGQDKNLTYRFVGTQTEKLLLDYSALDPADEFLVSAINLTEGESNLVFGGEQSWALDSDGNLVTGGGSPEGFMGLDKITLGRSLYSDRPLKVVSAVALGLDREPTDNGNVGFLDEGYAARVRFEAGSIELGPSICSLPMLIRGLCGSGEPITKPDDINYDEIIANTDHSLILVMANSLLSDAEVSFNGTSIDAVADQVIGVYAVSGRNETSETHGGIDSTLYRTLRSSRGTAKAVVHGRIRLQNSCRVRPEDKWDECPTVTPLDMVGVKAYSSGASESGPEKSYRTQGKENVIVEVKQNSASSGIGQIEVGYGSGVHVTTRYGKTRVVVGKASSSEGSEFTIKSGRYGVYLGGEGKENGDGIQYESHTVELEEGAIIMAGKVTQPGPILRTDGVAIQLGTGAIESISIGKNATVTGDINLNKATQHDLLGINAGDISLDVAGPEYVCATRADLNDRAPRDPCVYDHTDLIKRAKIEFKEGVVFNGSLVLGDGNDHVDIMAHTFSGDRILTGGGKDVISFAGDLDQKEIVLGSSEDSTRKELTLRLSGVEQNVPAGRIIANSLDTLIEVNEVDSVILNVDLSTTDRKNPHEVKIVESSSDHRETALNLRPVEAGKEVYVKIDTDLDRVSSPQTFYDTGNNNFRKNNTINVSGNFTLMNPDLRYTTVSTANNTTTDKLVIDMDGFKGAEEISIFHSQCIDSDCNYADHDKNREGTRFVVDAATHDTIEFTSAIIGAGAGTQNILRKTVGNDTINTKVAIDVQNLGPGNRFLVSIADSSIDDFSQYASHFVVMDARTGQQINPLGQKIADPVTGEQRDFLVFERDFLVFVNPIDTTLGEVYGFHLMSLVGKDYALEDRKNAFRDGFEERIQLSNAPIWFNVNMGRDEIAKDQDKMKGKHDNWIFSAGSTFSSYASGETRLSYEGRVSFGRSKTVALTSDDPLSEMTTTNTSFAVIRKSMAEDGTFLDMSFGFGRYDGELKVTRDSFVGGDLQSPVSVTGYNLKMQYGRRFAFLDNDGNNRFSIVPKIETTYDNISGEDVRIQNIQNIAGITKTTAFAGVTLTSLTNTASGTSTVYGDVGFSEDLSYEYDVLNQRLNLANAKFIANSGITWNTFDDSVELFLEASYSRSLSEDVYSEKNYDVTFGYKTEW